MKVTAILLTAATGLAACASEPRPNLPRKPSEATLNLLQAAVAIEDGEWGLAAAYVEAEPRHKAAPLLVKWLERAGSPEADIGYCRDAMADGAVEHARRALDELIERAKGGPTLEDYLALERELFGATLALEGAGRARLTSKGGEDHDLTVPSETGGLDPGWYELVHRPGGDAPARRFMVRLVSGEATRVDLADVGALYANAVRLGGVDYLLGGAVRAVVGGRPEHPEPDALWFPDHVDEALERVGSPLFLPERRTEAGDPVAVDAVVLHHDLVRDSKRCFEVLVERGLSTHFMVDWDGTVFQGADTRSLVFHAGENGPRSVGIDLNNLGVNLVREPDSPPYDPEHPRFAEMSKHARPRSAATRINGGEVQMHGYTDAQYDALARLLSALMAAHEGIAPEIPLDAYGRVMPNKLSDAATRRGILAHWHVAEDRWDPGPGLDWRRLCRELVALGVPMRRCGGVDERRPAPVRVSE